MCMIQIKRSIHDSFTASDGDYKPDTKFLCCDDNNNKKRSFVFGFQSPADVTKETIKSKGKYENKNKKIKKTELN